jgi:hypothetical protein
MLPATSPTDNSHGTGTGTYFVKMTLTLPEMTLAEFRVDEQKFKVAVASAASVPVTAVDISFPSTGRRLLALDLTIAVTITTTSDTAATNAVSGLNSGLAARLTSIGFPKPVITLPPAILFVPLRPAGTAIAAMGTGTYFVRMSLTLPITLAQFDATMQQKFKVAVASAASVPVTAVDISFASTGRRLLASRLVINVTIATTTAAAATAAISSMTSSPGLFTKLANEGFLNVAITSAPALVGSVVPAAMPTNTNSSGSTTKALGSGAGHAQPGLSTLASLLLATLAAAASGAAAASSARR